MRLLFGLRARIVLWLGGLMASLLLIGLPLLGILASQREIAIRQQVSRGAALAVEAQRSGAEAAAAHCDSLDAVWPGIFIEVDGARVCGDSAAAGAVPIRRQLEGGVVVVSHVDRAEALQLLRLSSIGIVGWALLLVFLTLVATWRLISRWIVEPLHALRRASEKISEGSTAVELPILKGTELALLNASFQEMAAAVAQQREEIAAQLEELRASHLEVVQAQESMIRFERVATAGQLSSGLAHEIGNPLSAIMGMVAVLRRSSLSDEAAADLLARIESELERIDEMIRTLLEYARKPVPAGEVADAASVINNVQTLLEHHKGAQGIGVAVTAPEGGWGEVAARASEFEQVLLNLLLNSADSLAAAGRAEPIEIRGEDRGGALVMDVVDQGAGFESDAISQATVPFFTTKAPGKGTGLGLAVVEWIVTGWGGELTFSPGRERGAVVRLTIPRP